MRAVDRTVLPDWSNPDRNLWPPLNSFAAEVALSMAVPQHPGPMWSDPIFQERRRAEIAAEQERMALHAEAQARQQLDRENKELREQFQQRQQNGELSIPNYWTCVLLSLNSSKNLSRDDLIQRVEQLQIAVGKLHDAVFGSDSLFFPPRSEAPALPFGLIGAVHAQQVTPPAVQPTAQPVTPPAVQPTAQPVTPPAVQPAAQQVTPPAAQMRMWIMVLVFIVLGITFIISVAAIFKTTNTEVLKFAFDTAKTLLGFFIGVATTLIGTL